MYDPILKGHSTYFLLSLYKANLFRLIADKYVSLLLLLPTPSLVHRNKKHVSFFLLL